MANKPHTRRIVGILKGVLEDIDKLNKKTGVVTSPTDVIAYTAKTTLDNILRHDVEGMIREFESGE
jgi:hypothetical protein